MNVDVIWSRNHVVCSLIHKKYQNFGHFLVINPFIHNVKKMVKRTLKILGVNTARFLKYVLAIFNTMHERVKLYKNGVNSTRYLKGRKYIPVPTDRFSLQRVY